MWFRARTVDVVAALLSELDSGKIYLCSHISEVGPPRKAFDWQAFGTCARCTRLKCLAESSPKESVCKCLVESHIQTIVHDWAG